MGSSGEGSFTSSPQTLSTSALLFDFDGKLGFDGTGHLASALKGADRNAGTVIDSTAAVVKHWQKQGAIIGVDPQVILATSHGRRSIDVFRVLSPDKANWDYVCQQERLIPIEFGSDAEELPGARRLLANLDAINAPWAVVTSATRPLLDGWLGILKLARPQTIVTAEDVEDGKPDPTCYRLGRKRLGLEQGTDALVFEDAPSGIRAGKAAGFTVVGLTTTHTAEQVMEAGADWVIRDLSSVSVKGIEAGVVHIEIQNAYQT